MDDRLIKEIAQRIKQANIEKMFGRPQAMPPRKPQTEPVQQNIDWLARLALIADPATFAHFKEKKVKSQEDPAKALADAPKEGYTNVVVYRDYERDKIVTYGMSFRQSYFFTHDSKPDINARAQSIVNTFTNGIAHKKRVLEVYSLTCGVPIADQLKEERAWHLD